MAEGKKSFVLYADLIGTVEKMPNDKAGELFKHVLMYVNDQDPETDDLLVQIAFEPIKNQLKRDLKKWEQLREKRSQAGKRSAEARKNKKEQNQQVLTSVESVEQTSTKSTVNVNDTVTVNVNVESKDSLFIKKEDVQHELMNSASFQESVFRQLNSLNIKTTPEQVVKLIPVFCEKLEIEEDLDKDFKEIKRHFLNWVKQEIPKINRNEQQKSSHDKSKESYQQTANAIFNTKWDEKSEPNDF